MLAPNLTTVRPGRVKRVPMAPEDFSRGSLAVLADHPAVVRAKKLKAYRLALGVADWHYEHCDNAEAWRAGRDEFRRLYEMQAEVDPSGAIWNTVAPAGMAVPQPRVIGGVA